MFDLGAELPRLLPKAVKWAEYEAAAAQATGVPLNATGLRLAHLVGVEHPELIRVVEAQVLPFPTDPELGFAAQQAGLLGPGMIGLTLGYAIFILRGHGASRLISHECRHVYQYETAGSIAAFLPLYLAQIATYGYQNAPFEIDARAHERDLV
jgi:hypothetical protein